MKRFKPRMLALTVALGALLGGGTAAAQDFTFGWNPRSGDVWVDTWLTDINRYGRRYQQPFIDEMVRYHGAPRGLVTELLLERGWAPGDIYFACAIAEIIGRPCRFVVQEWEQHHGEGWGALAKRLGIKPGSPEFHRLKRGFVPTYDRWGRSIVIDADLHDDFPGRAKAAKGRSDRGGPPAHAGGPGKAKEHGDRGKGNGKGKGHDKGGRGKH
jgi:hypothetical protein